MAVIQEGNIVKKHFFFESYCVWSKEQFQPSSIVKWRINMFISKEHCKHTLLHVQYIWQIFLFQEYRYFREMLTAIDFKWIVSISGDHFKFLFWILCFSEINTCNHNLFQRSWLVFHMSYRNPFYKRPLFYSHNHIFFQVYHFFRNGSSNKEVVSIIVSNLITNYHISLVEFMCSFED